MFEEIVEGNDQQVSVLLPKGLIQIIDELIQENKFSNRSSFIRIAIRNLLIQEKIISTNQNLELDAFQLSKHRKATKEIFGEQNHERRKTSLSLLQK